MKRSFFLNLLLAFEFKQYHNSIIISYMLNLKSQKLYLVK